MASLTPTGQRSPRWALMTRFTIPCEDGQIYLFRLRIIQTPWFALYLHDIFEPDADRDPHNHPWSFISIVLRGGYTERLYLDPVRRPKDYVERTYPRFSVHRMGRTTAHRIVEAAPGLKTLILVGPRSREGWGFFRPREVQPQDFFSGDLRPGDVVGEFIPWQQYEDEQQ
jgi:hypothetical protein